MALLGLGWHFLLGLGLLTVGLPLPSCVGAWPFLLGVRAGPSFSRFGSCLLSVGGGCFFLLAVGVGPPFLEWGVGPSWRLRLASSGVGVWPFLLGVGVGPASRGVVVGPSKKKENISTKKKKTHEKKAQSCFCASRRNLIRNVAILVLKHWETGRTWAKNDCHHLTDEFCRDAPDTQNVVVTRAFRKEPR